MSFGRSLTLCIMFLASSTVLAAQDSNEPPAPATPKYTTASNKTDAGPQTETPKANAEAKSPAEENDKDEPRTGGKQKRKKGKRKKQESDAEKPSATVSKDGDKKADDTPKPDAQQSEKDMKPEPKKKPATADGTDKPKSTGKEAKSDGDGKNEDKKTDKAKEKKKKAPQKDPKTKKAYTTLDSVDEDFAFQGEFVGDILPDDTFDTQGQQQIGLQVVAMGDGQFQGMRYANGLPGVSWFSGEKEKLSGSRDGDVLTLKGDKTEIQIVNNRAIVRSTIGNLLGEFHKTKRSSPRLGAEPPSNAIVLFDGSNTDKFKNGKILEDGSLKMGTEFIDGYKDFTLHLEFMLPYMPHARGQGRSNSGVYMLSRYEVQILDTFGLETEFNHCGALYRYQKPNVNMCLPPLTWQTYDITFFSPKFDADGNKIANGVLTVLHNGVKIHDNFQVERKTGAGKPEGPEVLPTKLQDHSNPVKFKNIWLVDHSNYSVPEPQPTYLSQPESIANPVSETYYPPTEYPASNYPTSEYPTSEYPAAQPIDASQPITYPAYGVPVNSGQ